MSPGSASQLGDLGGVTFSIHSSISCLSEWITMQVKVRDQGGVFPGQTHWEAGTCNSPFPLESPQLATTLESKNTSDAPSLPAALPSTQLSNLPMPTTPGTIWQFPLPADHRGQEGDTTGQLQGKATLTSGRSLWVLTASMFSEMDSTRQPAGRSTKRQISKASRHRRLPRSLLSPRQPGFRRRYKSTPLACLGRSHSP